LNKSTIQPGRSVSCWQRECHQLRRSSRRAEARNGYSEKDIDNEIIITDID